MAKPGWLEALEHRLGELKGVSDALWDSLERRVGTFKVRMGVQGSGSSNAPQVERLIVIKESQRQLGNTLKDLSTKVKDSIAAFQSGVNKLAATEKVTMMALGKSPQECGASKCYGKEKVSKPRPNAGERNA